MSAREIQEHNRAAWDREADLRNPATVPASDELIAGAKAGRFDLSITGGRPVPRLWYGDLRGARVLCIALGGGQQVPLLAAAGAQVTSFENSPRQLASDREMCARHGLNVVCELGDMQDLARFKAASFDLVVIGLGLQFVPDPESVWRQVGDLLPRSGRVIAALMNPVGYVFRWPEASRGELIVAHALPYSDVSAFTEEERKQRFGPDAPLEFGHTLETLLGGLISAGFLIGGFFEDYAEDDPLANYLATYFAVLGLTPALVSTCGDRPNR